MIAFLMCNGWGSFLHPSNQKKKKSFVFPKQAIFLTLPMFFYTFKSMIISKIHKEILETFYKDILDKVWC